MNIGKARALFEQVASGEYRGSTVCEYLEAVKIVLDMETHNSISKKMIISVCKWLVKIAEKAVSPYRWIPCENDLPDIGMTVLFCDIDGDEFIGHRALHWWWSVDEKVKNVIAWMPLPEAYKPNKK